MLQYLAHHTVPHTTQTNYKHAAIIAGAVLALGIIILITARVRK